MFDHFWLSLRHWCSAKTNEPPEWLCISFLLISLKLLSTSELRHQLRLWGQRHSQTTAAPSSSMLLQHQHTQKFFFPIAISWRVSALLWISYQSQLFLKCCYYYLLGLKSYLMVARLFFEAKLRWPAHLLSNSTTYLPTQYICLIHVLPSNQQCKWKQKLSHVVMF